VTGSLTKLGLRLPPNKKGHRLQMSRTLFHLVFGCLKQTIWTSSHQKKSCFSCQAHRCPQTQMYQQGQEHHPHSRGAVLGKRRRVGGSSGRTGADDEAPVAARMPAAMLLVWGRCNWLGGSHRLDPHGIALGRAGKRISLDSTIGPDAACLRGAAFGMAPSPPSTPARPGITPPGGLRRSEAGNRRR